MSPQNTGEQVDQDSGDLISFRNKPQSRFTVKPASVNPFDPNYKASHKLIMNKSINACHCINNVFWPPFMYVAHTFLKKALWEPKHPCRVPYVYTNVQMYIYIHLPHYMIRENTLRGLKRSSLFIEYLIRTAPNGNPPVLHWLTVCRWSPFSNTLDAIQ